MTNVQAFIQAWQAQALLSSSSQGGGPLSQDTIKEPPNALVLAINLQNCPLKDTAEWIRVASPEEIKAHKGVRTSFYIAKILYPGFTFVPPPAGADKSVKGDRLAIFDSEEEKRTVLFYTYKGEQNQKLDTYVKTKRFQECTSVTQGMIVTGTMWANKMEKKAKSGTQTFDNIAPFQLCWVQLGIRSIMAKASENGMILEIKSITAVSSQYSLSSCALVPHDAVTHSIQASVDFRNKFLEGEFVSAEKRKHLKQELLKGNCSTTMHLVALIPRPEDGTIALSADGKIKFFQQQPIGDVQATTIELVYDSAVHYPLGRDDGVEWMAKFFNIAMFMGALELFVIVDEYRMRKKEGIPPQHQDVHLQAYARLNDKHVLANCVPLSASAPALDAVMQDESDIHAYISGQGVDTKHLVIFQQCAKDLDLVVDMRRMLNKRAPATSFQGLSSLVHPDAQWSKGHMLHVFFEKKCVLSLVVSLSDVQVASDPSVYKRALEAVQLVECADVEYDDPPTAPSSTSGANANGKPPKAKKSKPVVPAADTPTQP